ncbi:MAG: tetratricopeptide repeat protein [Sedimentisphaerales bacterium]
MISFSCKCGKKYNVDDKYAGKKVICKQCDAFLFVPQNDYTLMTEVVSNEPHIIENIRTTETVIPKWIKYLVVAIAVFLISFLLWAFVLRDTWEADNYEKMRNLAESASSAITEKQYEKGLATYEELFQFVGNHKLKRLYTKKKYDEAKIFYEEAKTEQIKRKRIAAAEERRQKTESLKNQLALTEPIQKAYITNIEEESKGTASKSGVELYKKYVDDIQKVYPDKSNISEDMKYIFEHVDRAILFFSTTEFAGNNESLNIAMEEMNVFLLEYNKIYNLFIDITGDSPSKKLPESLPDQSKDEYAEQKTRLRERGNNLLQTMGIDSAKVEKYDPMEELYNPDSILGLSYPAKQLLNYNPSMVFNQSKQAAENGNVKAYYLLAQCFDIGIGTSKNSEQAVLWYSKAADAGNYSAMVDLGLIYYNGKSLPQDYNEALKWYSKAAEQGESHAQNNLGLMYYNGQGVLQDYKEALKWYSKAAEQGEAMAQYSLGVMYDNGQGVLQDYKEAFKWSSKAAEQGHAQAQVILGFMYHDGRGVSQDYKEAFKWVSKAALQGYVPAQSLLGVWYYNGKGVSQDLIEALKWTLIAEMNKDDDNVAKFKKELKSIMTSGQIAQAIDLAEKFVTTSSITNPTALSQLGKERQSQKDSELSIQFKIENISKIADRYYDADKIVAILPIEGGLIEEMVVCLAIDKTNAMISVSISKQSANDFSRAVDNPRYYGSAFGESQRYNFEQKALQDLANTKSIVSNYEDGEMKMKVRLLNDTNFRQKWDEYVKKYKDSSYLPENIRNNLAYSSQIL